MTHSLDQSCFVSCRQLTCWYIFGFAGLEAHIAKICVRGYNFSLKRPTLGRLTPYLFFSRKSFLTLLTFSAHIARVTVTVVRHRKFLTTLRTNQIAGFVTASSSKKNYMVIASGRHFSTFYILIKCRYPPVN